MPTDFLVYPLAVDEKGKTVRVDEQTGVQDERRRTMGGIGRIGRKARFVDSKPLSSPPSDSSHVHFPLSSRFPAVAGTMAAPHRAALLPPIDRETRNGDSLNLDPVLMEHSPDNGFGML